MEADKNPFPNIDLFPRITRIAKAIGGLFCLHQLSPISEHFQQENTGGGPALDRALYDQPDNQMELF